MKKLILVLLLCSAPAFAAATATWTNGASTGLWSNGGNWSGGTGAGGVPGTTDNVVFNGVSSTNCSVDNVSTWAGSLSLNAGYSATVTDNTANMLFSASQTLLVSAGTLDLNGNTLSTGNFTQTAGTVLGGTNTITVSGAFSATGGAFTSTSGTLSVSGNFTGSSGFNANAGTVLLAGGSQSVSGTTTFYNLAKTLGASAATLTFQNGVTQSVTNTLTLNGTAAAYLTLVSNSPGNQWLINATGPRTLNYLTVKDSNNIAPQIMFASNSTLVSNDRRWFISPAPLLSYGTSPMSLTAGTWSIASSGQYAQQTSVLTPVNGIAQLAVASTVTFAIATGETVAGVMLYCRQASTSGSVTVTLYASGSPTAATVTVPTSSIPSNYSWCYFPFAGSVTGNGNQVYNIIINAPTGSIYFYQDNYTADWARIIFTTTTTGVVNGNIPYVAAPINSGLTFTVTLDDTTGSNIYYGMTICSNGQGVLASATTTTYGFQFSGNVYVFGELDTGTPANPLPPSSKATFQLLCTQPNVGAVPQYSFNIYDGAVWYSQGTTVSPCYSLLTANAAAGGTQLTVAGTTNWTSGSALGLAPTDTTITNYEQVTMSGPASGTTVPISACTKAHLGTPVQAEVVNMSRNIVFKGGSLVNVGIIYIGSNASVHLYYTEFGWMYSALSVISLPLSYSTGPSFFDIEYCSMHDASNTSFYGLNIGSSTFIYPFTFSNNVNYGLMSNTIPLSSINTSYTCSNNVNIGGYTGFSLNTGNENITNNRTSGNSNYGFSFTNGIYTGGGTFTGNVAHNCDIGMFTNVTNGYTFGLTTIWGCTSIGLSSGYVSTPSARAACYNNTFNNFNLFSNLADLDLGNWYNNTLNNCTFNPGTLPIVGTIGVDAVFDNDGLNNYFNNCTFGNFSNGAFYGGASQNYGILSGIYLYNSTFGGAVVGAQTCFGAGTSISSVNTNGVLGSYVVYSSYGHVSPDFTINMGGSPSSIMLYNHNLASDVSGDYVASMTLGLTYAQSSISSPSQFTGSMITGRRLHSSAALTTGKILAIAGSGPGGGDIQSCELYDPTTGTWTATGSCLYTHSLDPAVTLQNGNIILVSDMVNFAEQYNPSTGLWTAAGTTSEARSGHGSCLLNSGQVLIAGGIDTNTFTGLSSCELYDPITNSWSLTGSLSTDRNGVMLSILPNGNVLAVGGYSQGLGGQLATAQIFNGSTWSAAASAPNVFSSGSATRLSNGLVLVQASGYAYLYNYLTNSWTNAGSGSISTYKGNVPVLLANGNVLIMDGTTGAASSNLVYQYAPTPNTLTPLCPTLLTRVNPQAQLLPNGSVLVFGGNKGIYDTTPSATSEIYNPVLAGAGTTLFYTSVTPSGFPDLTQLSTSTWELGSYVSIVPGGVGTFWIEVWQCSAAGTDTALLATTSQMAIPTTVANVQTYANINNVSISATDRLKFKYYYNTPTQGAVTLYLDGSYASYIRLYDPVSSRISPNSTLGKTGQLVSRKVPVIKGQQLYMTAWARPSITTDGTAYTGNAPRLMLAPNYAAGISALTVLSTAGSSITGAVFSVAGTTASGAGTNVIQCTTVAPHGLSEQDNITISGATGTINLNGNWMVHYLDAYNFTLNGSNYTGSYTASTGYFGKWLKLQGLTPVTTDSGVLTVYVDCDGASGWINVNWPSGSNYWENGLPNLPSGPNQSAPAQAN